MQTIKNFDSAVASHKNGKAVPWDPYFKNAERQFMQFLGLKNLDQQIKENPTLVQAVKGSIETAFAQAFANNAGSPQAHLFLQRILYRINRLKFFWYDDLSHYENEGSLQLASIRNQIESVWQQWEMQPFSNENFQDEDVETALRKRARADLAPPPSEIDLFFSETISENGYRRLLAIASLDGLVEASQLSRVLGGVGNEVQSMLTRLLIEEYGAGRLARKHSSFFNAMLDSMGMQTQPEAYLPLVPWEVLANINHSFFLSERKRHFLRYVGGLLYTEVSVPAGFENFRKAAERLNLPVQAREYWEVHIKVDKRHGQWMLEDIAIPLVSKYEHSAWEMILGYDQQKSISARAGTSIARSIMQSEVK